MCPHCADRSDRALARRAYVLQLLALVEHPSALPTEAALRIGLDLLAWAEHDGACCEGEDDRAAAASRRLERRCA